MTSGGHGAGRPALDGALGSAAAGRLARLGAVRSDFERRLAAQESRMVIGPRIDSEVRRGQDYVRVVVVATIVTADVAQAAIVAWRGFRRAAGPEPAGGVVAAAPARAPAPRVAS